MSCGDPSSDAVGEFLADHVDGDDDDHDGDGGHDRGQEVPAEQAGLAPR